MYERVGESVIVVYESDRCILMALKKTRNLFLIAISEEKNRQPLDNRWTTLGRPEDTQGTKEDQRRDGGRLIDRFVKHWHRVAQNVVQWRSVGRANVQRATFNG